MMVTVKDLFNGAAAAAVGALAVQSGAQARSTLDTRSGAEAGLNEVAAYDGYDAVATHQEFAQANKPAITAAPVPAPAPAPLFNFTGGNATDVPCAEVEFLAALDLIIVDLDAANATDCGPVNGLNQDIFSSLQSAFGPQVATSDPYVQGVYAKLDSELQAASEFTQRADVCDNVTTYNNRINTSVENMFDTLSLLQNVTTCEPFIN